MSEDRRQSKPGTVFALRVYLAHEPGFRSLIGLLCDVLFLVLHHH